MKSIDNIMERLKRNDSKAFRDFFEYYYVDLCQHSLKYCDSFSMSEDVVQEFFIKFWDERIYLKIQGSVESYMYKSIRNNTLQAMRKNKKHSVELLEDILFDENTLIEVDSSQEKSHLFNRVEALPQRSKEVFKAIALDGLKYKEVAALFGISKNTVKTHYMRSLKKLRD